MEIEERVISVFKKNIGKKYEITLNSNLIKDLGIDSFDKLMIIAGVEDEFSITIDEQDFKNFITVKDIIDKLKENNIA